MECIDFESEVSKLNIVERLSDIVRIVDPIRKTVHVCKIGNGEALKPDLACYAFWDRGTACENCISMRACTLNKTMVKLEVKGQRVFLVTSIPLETGSNARALELVKDITDDLMNGSDDENIDRMRKMISQISFSVTKNRFTNFFNETFIFERLPYDIFLYSSTHKPVTLFRIKLTNARSINSTFGVALGDTVLTEVSRVISQFVKNVGSWASNYRGTEFVLLIHGVDEYRALKICHQIEYKIGQLKFNFENSVVIPEISIGFHVLKDETLTPGQFFGLAGKNLFSENISTGTEDDQISASYLMDRWQLTKREAEIAILLIQGKTNAEISKELFIGLTTVKKHVASILNKAGVRNRSAFLLLAFSAKAENYSLIQ